MLMKILTLGLAAFGLWILLRRAFAPAPPRAEDPAAPRPRLQAEDLEACPHCGAYKAPDEPCASCRERSRRDQPPGGGSGRA
ncbi:hypothetical protein [Neomegalonema perideroedes]|uniref:hypothetical protein n=1 Tax=Neomegalonema perideroedes TaxID=217219 RepID=UPI00036381BD|nr:hypothetical protein [Neomegalonema perideroedes]